MSLTALIMAFLVLKGIALSLSVWQKFTDVLLLIKFTIWNILDWERFLLDSILLFHIVTCLPSELLKLSSAILLLKLLPFIQKSVVLATSFNLSREYIEVYWDKQIERHRRSTLVLSVVFVPIGLSTIVMIQSITT